MNLEKLKVTELSATEAKEIDGGFFPFFLYLILAKKIAKKK